MTRTLATLVLVLGLLGDTIANEIPLDSRIVSVGMFKNGPAVVRRTARIGKGAWPVNSRTKLEWAARVKPQQELTIQYRYTLLVNN